MSEQRSLSETYTGISRLKYKLESQTLKEWAIKYGIVDLAYNVGSSHEIYLGNVRVEIGNLSANDKALIQKVIDWIVA